MRQDHERNCSSFAKSEIQNRNILTRCYGEITKTLLSTASQWMNKAIQHIVH